MARLKQFTAWLGRQKRQVLIHSLILAGFLVYCLFFAQPLFARFEDVPGQAVEVSLKLPYTANNVTFSLDQVIPSSSALEINGWAFINGQDTQDLETYLVLKSAQTSYIFTTTAVYSNPITTEYGNGLNLDWAGFTTIVPMQKIKSGSYTVGLYLYKDGAAVLQYTGETITKTRGEVTQAEE
jgi:hypothetical protein